MSDKRFQTTAAAMACSLLCLFGCSKASDNGGGAATVPEDADSQTMQVLQQASELYSAGSTNEAEALLAAKVSDESFTGNRGEILSALADLMIRNGKVDETKEMLLAEYVRKEPGVNADRDAVFNFYMGSSDTSNAVAWTESVLSREGVAPVVKAAFREMNFVALVMGDDHDKAVAAAMRFVDIADGESLKALNRGIELAFDLRKLDLVEALLSKASRTITSVTELKNIIVSAKLRLFAEQSKWAELGTAFPSSARILPDRDLSRVLRRVSRAAIRARAFDTADAMCRLVLTNAADKTTARNTAAEMFVMSAAGSNPDDIPDRIENLITEKIDGETVCAIFTRHFYDTVNAPSTVAEMRAIGERIATLATDEYTKESIITMTLDSCFLVNDFDAALVILNKGVPGNDEDWHKMAIAKVSAHKALAENRPLDAIKFFRSFMAAMEAGKESVTRDPSTGDIHTKNMILGRNAKRIGDIYAELVKDAESAKAAYVEARGYYQKDLDAQPPLESEVVTAIKAELATVPNQ